MTIHQLTELTNTIETYRLPFDLALMEGGLRVTYGTQVIMANASYRTVSTWLDGIIFALNNMDDDPETDSEKPPRIYTESPRWAVRKGVDGLFEVYDTQNPEGKYIRACVDRDAAEDFADWKNRGAAAYQYAPLAEKLNPTK